MYILGEHCSGALYESIEAKGKLGMKGIYYSCFNLPKNGNTVANIRNLKRLIVAAGTVNNSLVPPSACNG